MTSIRVPTPSLSALCLGWVAVAAALAACDAGGGVEVAQAPAPLVFEDEFQTVTADGTHNAFPSLVLLRSGRLVLGYRKGQAHTLDSGRIVLRTSDDGAATWSSERTVVSDSVHDVREPSLRQLSDGRLSMSWFVSRTTDSSPVGAYHATSTDAGETWSAPVLVAMGAATQDGVVEVPGGDWVLAVYQPDPDRPGAFRPYVSASTDGGQTWSTRAELAHPDATLAFSEASITLLFDGRLYLVLREETELDVYASASDDRGRTWSRPEHVVRNGWGGPHVLRLSNASLLMSYRSTAAGRPIEVLQSGREGERWGGAVTFETAFPEATTSRSVYAEAVECGGEVLMVYGMEGDDEAEVRLRRAFRGGPTCFEAVSGLATSELAQQ